MSLDVFLNLKIIYATIAERKMTEWFFPACTYITDIYIQPKNIR